MFTIALLFIPLIPLVCRIDVYKYPESVGVNVNNDIFSKMIFFSKKNFLCLFRLKHLKIDSPDTNLV